MKHAVRGDISKQKRLHTDEDTCTAAVYLQTTRQPTIILEEDLIALQVIFITLTPLFVFSAADFSESDEV